MAPFAPVIEKSTSSGTAFLTKSPKEIFEAKESYDVPAVYGAVSEEGCYPGAGFLLSFGFINNIHFNI